MSRGINRGPPRGAKKRYSTCLIRVKKKAFSFGVVLSRGSLRSSLGGGKGIHRGNSGSFKRVTTTPPPQKSHIVLYWIIKKMLLDNFFFLYIIMRVTTFLELREPLLWIGSDKCALV